MIASDKLSIEVESFVDSAWTRTEAYLTYSRIVSVHSPFLLRPQREWGCA